MNVRQLIEQLQSMNPDAEVHYSYNYGDHWRTQVAPTVDRVEEGVVEHSSYHDMDRMVDDEDDMYDEETGNFKDTVRQVVVLT